MLTSAWGLPLRKPAAAALCCAVTAMQRVIAAASNMSGAPLLPVAARAASDASDADAVGTMLQFRDSITDA